MSGKNYDDPEKEIIQALGDAYFERLSQELENYLNERPPYFDLSKPNGKGYIDREVFNKHRGASMLNLFNCLEKAARMKKGMIGREVIEKEDDTREVEELLRQVMEKRKAKESD